MKQQVLIKSLIFLISVVLVNTAYAADDTKGQLRGTVLDQSGVPVAGATVRVTHEQMGTTRSASTDEDGTYIIPALNTGDYTVVITQNGEVIKQAENVSVGIGSRTIYNVGSTGVVEEVFITGVKGNALDTSSAVKDFVVDVSELSGRIPIPRDLTSVALLAPSTAAADRTFAANNHDSPALSISGASAAENACFVNGLNVTNFRNGLGCSQLPFEFYDQIQIKNGGYNAEFGRSIGGVMNATTKKGGNDFHFGANLFYEPDALYETSPNTFGAINDLDERDQLSMDLWASGAIIQDRLFYYALVSPNKRQAIDAGTNGIYFDSEWDDLFWGLKLDFIIADGHTLEYTGFDDYREETENAYEFNPDSREVGDRFATTVYKRGGENHLFKYTGVLNDIVTISALYGLNEYERTDIGDTDNMPAIIDYRSGTRVDLGSWGNLIPARKTDEREAIRFDVDLFLGDHNVRFGVDREEQEAEELSFYSGGNLYIYDTVGADTDYDGAVAEDGTVIAPGDDYVEFRTLLNAGSFETITTALYIQDEWTVNDRLTVHAGIRNETFDNKNAEGDSFIKVDDQWAPRLGVSFDPTGNESSRVYANFGRYFLPIATNTNIRMAGAELFTIDWYLLEGLNADDTPIFDPETRFDSAVFADGTVPDTSSILDTSIEPMYQDEYILGYEWFMGEWELGVRGVYRELKSTIEDIAVDAALNEFVEAETGETDFAGGFDYYVLTNPGTDIDFYVDYDSDGELEPVTLSSESLGYPKATRKYKALEFTFDRVWDDRWMLQGSLVLAESRGNHEGYVKSDNGQDDAGITTSFDQPGLTHGATGDLPNDRPWAVKTFGAYQFNNGIMVGANFLASAGRPISCIGVVPSEIDPHAGDYGAESFYCGGELGQRGGEGRTDTIYNFDLSLQYEFDLPQGNLLARTDIFNVFNFDNVAEVREIGEDDGGAPDENFLKPIYYQSPRSVRFSLSYRF